MLVCGDDLFQSRVEAGQDGDARGNTQAVFKHHLVSIPCRQDQHGQRIVRVAAVAQPGHCQGIRTGPFDCLLRRVVFHDEQGVEQRSSAGQLLDLAQAQRGMLA